ncbi:hypothetical protein AMTR_s00034p00129610 [Amborella trichopoda]|uniref:Aminotransferase-like plant mobile domain-containing protein n=1 Tax=Amborella trichopoda TaxID=13333 RepID=W1PXN7_AMBTC|nr:hypothetical protein AMTR_s00034p00129610 [Amborella trichopoda]
MTRIPLYANPVIVRYRLETCSIPLRCGELAPTLEDVTQILGVWSEGEPLLCIPQGMFTSYGSYCKGILGIPFEKIRGRYDSEIHLGKLRWEFTGVLHYAERMIGGRAPQVSVSVGRRPSHKGQAPVEEDGAGVSESMQGESSYPLSRGAAQSSGDAKGVGHDIPDLGDESSFSIEIYSLRAFLAHLFREFLFVGRSKDRAHLSMVWATRRLDYLEQVAWGLVIVGWLHHDLCSVDRGARYLRGCSIFLQVWAWEHIPIPRPIPGRLALSFPTIHCW